MVLINYKPIPNLHDSNHIEKQSEELVSLVYGSIISQVIGTSENMTETNFRLQKIGQRIGNKIVDQYMKQMGKPCTKIIQLVQRFANNGVRRYLGASQCRYEEYKLTEKGFSFNLKIINNPLLKNLEVLGDLKTGGLKYQSIIQGAIKGAFQVIKFKTEVILTYQSVRIDKNETVFFIDAVKM